MRACSDETGLDIKIFGPETHATAIVPLALGLAQLEDFPEFDADGTSGVPLKRRRVSSRGSLMEEDMDVEDNGGDDKTGNGGGKPRATLQPQKADHEADHHVENFTAMTRCVVYGLQHQAVQGMLDFDYMCKRQKPSVAAMIFPFSSNHYVKFYWYVLSVGIAFGTNELRSWLFSHEHYSTISCNRTGARKKPYCRFTNPWRRRSRSTQK